MIIIVITNNPMVFDKFQQKTELLYIEDFTYLNVLEQARDKIHSGYTLLTHPLSGSVKPGETPYKTVILSKSSGALDLQSLSIIEESIATACKFLKNSRKRILSEKLHQDFQLIDYSLIRDCI